MKIIGYLGLLAIIAIVSYFALTMWERKHKPKKTMLHLMVDLETLSTASNAYIRSLGAVFFDRDGVNTLFYESCDGPSQQGAHIDQKTQEWWSKQSQIALQSLANARNRTLKETLEEFARWIEEERRIYAKDPVNPSDVEVCVWGNGSDFDPVILSNAFQRLGLPTPWKFYNVRCYRTLKNLFRQFPADEFKGEKHNALADAQHQAKHAVKILNGVGYWDAV